MLVGSGAESMELPTQLIQNRELILTGVFRYANTWPEAIALVESGRVDLDAMVTATIPAGEGPQKRWTPTARRVASRRWWPCHEAEQLDAGADPDQQAVLRPRRDRHRHSAFRGRRLPPCTPGDVRRPAAGEGLRQEWGICGVGVLPADRKMADVMAAQDGLYTLLLENPDGSRDARVIGSIVDYRYAPDDPEAVIELLAAPTTRIVSLTITEGGYNIEHIGPDDVSVFGLVADALARRRDRGLPSPTIVSCDNIEGNGDVARRGVHRLRRPRRTPASASGCATTPGSRTRWWTASRPVTTPDVIETLEDEFGVEDQWPVAAEPFTSWVLEDDFSDGRPPFEDVDVLLVDDVTPYELMKLRLLNASHQSLCYFAYLAGYRLVHDAAGDPLFAEFLLQYMDSEATPTLQPVPGIDLPDYKQHADRAVRQPRRARHHRAAVLRLVGPHPEMAAAR